MQIGILSGDDIGLEVVPECVKVMKAAAARERLAIDWQELPIGKRGHEQHGHTLPPVTEQALRELDGWIMGPIGHAAYPRGDPTWVMPPVRKKFDLFAAVRPALSHSGVPSIHKNVDIVFLREITAAVTFLRLRVRAISKASRATRLDPLRVITRMATVISSLGRNSGNPATTVSE
jgi:isocitrate/isopropylmalate dehydrogenase